MQLQIVLLIFAFNFAKILTQTQTAKEQSEIEDPPSPEWIRYQQERFQNIDKTPAGTYRETMRNNPQQKEPQMVKVHSKLTTTARQDGSHQQEEKEDQQAEFENKTKEPGAESMASGNAVEFPTIQGFIEFIKSLRQTWMKNSLFHIDDKIKMLHQLKDSLLKTIEKQFLVLWQDDDNDGDNDEDNIHKLQNGDSRKLHENKRNSHLRSKRGILDESSINFPPHAALMSINFLTFAVFLIKLVLQVVHIIKTKHYQYSSYNMDTGVIRNG